MVIHCSRKLFNYLAYPIEDACSEYDPVYSWYASKFYDDKRVLYIMLYNDASVFPLIVKVGGKDITGPFMLEAIETALLAQGYDKVQVDRYIQEGQKVTFTSTSNQTALSRVNRLIKSALALETDLEKAAEVLAGRAVTYQKKRIIPSQAMKTALEGESKEIVRALHEMVSLRVTLRLPPGFKVYRDFLVPTSLTFGQLHTMIQIGFGWDDMHLHEFSIGKYFRIGTPNNFAGMFGFDEEEIIDENRIRLDGLSPDIKKVTYTYDFGDGWVHTIRIGKRILQAEEPVALCTGGEGDTPWEDCGGPYGYADMVEILNDPDHEEYENIKEWVGDPEMQRFKIKQVNYMLSRVL